MDSRLILRLGFTSDADYKFPFINIYGMTCTFCSSYSPVFWWVMGRLYNPKTPLLKTLGLNWGDRLPNHLDIALRFTGVLFDANDERKTRGKSLKHNEKQSACIIESLHLAFTHTAKWGSITNEDDLCGKIFLYKGNQLRIFSTGFIFVPHQ